MRRPIPFFFLCFTLASFASADLEGQVPNKPTQPPAASPKPGPIFQEIALKHFAQWDGDKNGVLDGIELDKLVSDPNIKSSQAAAVAAMKRAMRSNKYECPPINRELIVKQATPAKGADGKATQPDFGSLYKNSLDRIEKANRVLFANAPKLDAIHQGRLGDCFCLAPLGAMLHRDPNAVKGMFESQADGKICVALGQNKIPVAPLTDCEIALTSSTEQQGLWVNTYEKAMGVYRAYLKGDPAPANPIDAISKGGSTSTAMEILTGHEIKRFILKPLRDPSTPETEKTEQKKKLQELLKENIQTKRLICASTGKELKLPPGMTPNHAYAVLGYEAEKQQVKIWNPHGSDFSPKGPAGLEHGYPRKDGLFSVPLDDMIQMYTSFSFETDQPAKPRQPVKKSETKKDAEKK